MSWWRSRRANKDGAAKRTASTAALRSLLTGASIKVEIAVLSSAHHGHRLVSKVRRLYPERDIPARSRHGITSFKALLLLLTATTTRQCTIGRGLD